MVYLSEQKIADTPGQDSLLQVPIPVDGVVSLSSEVFVDEGRLVGIDVVDLE